MRRIKFILIIILVNVAIKIICTISWQRGYLQSMRDRISDNRIIIDSLKHADDSLRVTSFSDHSEILTIKP